MKHGICIATAVLASSVNLTLAAAQSDASDARDILEKVGAVYRTPSTLELTGVQIDEQHDEWSDIANRTPFKLAAAADSKFRSESRMKMGTRLEVFDGNKTWNYVPLTNQYFTLEGKAETPFLVCAGVDLRAPAKSLKQAKILREELVASDQGKRRCDVIEVLYDQPEHSPNIEYGATTFWVDRESHVVWKRSVSMVMDMGKFGKMPASQTTTFSGIRTNYKIDPAAFTFTPPEGSTERKTGSAGPHAKALVGRVAPDFTLNTLDGKKVQLSSLKNKVVLLDFWATWCEPCRIEAPKLNSLSKKFENKNVVILGIDVLEDEETVRSFVKKNGYQYPILLTSDNKVLDDYAAHAYPSMVLIDKSGIVADYKVGSSDNSEKELEAAFVRISAPNYTPPKPEPEPSPQVTANSTPVVDLPEPVTAADFVHRGYRNLAMKNYEAAVQDATKALEKQPNLLAALRCRAQALYDLKDYEAAINEYSRLIDKYPDWPQLYDRRGLAYSHAGKFDRAISDYTKAISLDRYVAAPYTNRGSAYLETGDTARAMDDLNHAIELSPEDIKAYENRAKVWAKQGDRKNELADLEMILRIAPTNQWARDQRSALVRPAAANSLPAPALLSPSDEAVFDTYPRHTTLKWQASEQAASYIVQWDYSSDGVWASESRRGGFGEITTTKTESTFDFVGAQPGRWRVCLVDKDGQRGDWSEWRTFRYLR